jgi:hypothetical protein
MSIMKPARNATAAIMFPADASRIAETPQIATPVRIMQRIARPFEGNDANDSGPESVFNVLDDNVMRGWST